MLRNGPEGYGWLTKGLHWVTVLAVVTQFVVGYVMELDDRLLAVHVSLGVLIIALVLTRIGWRRIGGLPPWSGRLGPGERSFAHWTERLLLGLLLVIPATGLVLRLSGEDDLLWLHVTAHIALFIVLAAHVGLVLGRRLLPRML